MTDAPDPAIEETPKDRLEALGELAESIKGLTETVGRQDIYITNLMDSHEQLVDCVLKGVEMRAAQCAYFAKRTRENLIASKIAESDFDRMTKAIIAQMEEAKRAMAEAAQSAEASPPENPAHDA